MTMVEKVARALCVAGGHDPDFNYDPRGITGTADIRWQLFIPQARAAIKAMREPTSAMVRTGVDLALQTSLGGDYHWPDYIRDKHKTMIDAALAETPAHD